MSVLVFNDGYFAMKIQLFFYQNTEHLLKGFSVTITYMNLLFQYPNIRRHHFYIF